METVQKKLNLLWIWMICGALFTALWFECVMGKSPCSYCLLQRVAMAGLALCAFMNLRFGLRVEHYACSVLFSLLGLLVSFRLTPFGPILFGYHLSTLSAMGFLGSLVGEAFLLFLYSQTKQHVGFGQWGSSEKAIFFLFAFIVCANMIRFS